MFLLSEDLVRFYMERKRLQIRNFESANLFPTCYYFRLDRHAWLRDGSTSRSLEFRGDTVEVPPRAIVTTRSLEQFSLGEDTFALIGEQTAMFTNHGMQLLHGPTIDPGYDGALELALMNVTDQSTSINYGDVIGKATFFDISDSAIREARPTESARERMRRVWGTDDENPDAPWMKDDYI